MLRHSNFLVTRSGFCNQLEEALSGTSVADRIFETKNQPGQPKNISHKGENTESKGKISTSLTEQKTWILELTQVIRLLASTIQ